MTLVRRRSSIKGPLGEIGGTHPDAVADRDPVDGQHGLQVVGEAGDRGGVVADEGAGEPVGGGAGGIQGGRVAYRGDVGEHLPGGLIGLLGLANGWWNQQRIGARPGSRR
jgi:hypothetical protein